MTKVHGILGCKRDRHRNHKAQWSYCHSPIRRCPYEVSFLMRERPCHVLAHIVGKPMTYHVNLNCHSYIHSRTALKKETICLSYAQYSHTWTQLEQGCCKNCHDKGRSSCDPIACPYL